MTQGRGRDAGAPLGAKLPRDRRLGRTCSRELLCGILVGPLLSYGGCKSSDTPANTPPTSVSSRPPTGDVIPPDRRTTCNPGIPGGVPARPTVYATVDAAAYGNGSADATAGIQAARDGCPAGQDVRLSA